MRQNIQRLIEGPLAERILRSEFVAGDVVQVEATSDGFEFVKA